MSPLKITKLLNKNVIYFCIFKIFLTFAKFENSFSIAFLLKKALQKKYIMPAGAPVKNQNAEYWSLELSNELFNNALELSYTDDFDFIGEIARELKISRQLFHYLSEKYSELKNIYDIILSNLEANCFGHAKKGLIKEATAIINLKANYQWNDRSAMTVEHSGNISNTDYSKLSPEEIQKAIELSRKLRD